jgi:hypothetical protein
LTSARRPGRRSAEAALSAGRSIAYAVIEFDRYEGDLYRGITESYEFLPSTL